MPMMWTCARVAHRTGRIPVRHVRKTVEGTRWRRAVRVSSALFRCVSRRVTDDRADTVGLGDPGTLIILFRLLQYALSRTWLFPPRIELRDGVQGVVSRLPIPVTTGPVLLETPSIERNPVSEVSGKHRSRLFEFPDPPHTFEGLMLGAAVVFVLLTQTVVWSERLIAWFYPDYGQRRWGRKDFR